MSEPLSSNTGGVRTLDADAIEDLFSADDKPVVDKPVVEKPAGKEKEVDKGDKEEELELVEEEHEDVLDLKEKEDDEKEDDKDEEDDEDKDKEGEDDKEVDIDAPPRKKLLLKDYPDLFKKHPYLEKIIYRDRQYQEMFGSFDDAKEIFSKVETVNRWEAQLLNGRTEDIIKAVKDTDAKAFDKIVDNYLPALAKIDKTAYFEVVGNISKQLIAEMVAAAKTDDDDDLRAAALAVNKFLFGTTVYTPPKARTAIEDDTKVNEVEKERREYVAERLTTARNDIQTKVDNVLRSTINEYIDPRGVMPPFVKKQAIRECLDSVRESIDKDPSLRRNLDKLWKSALDEKFSKQALDRIQSAYLGRAKSSLPTAIKKIRAEALKDLPKGKRDSFSDKDKDEDDEKETPRRRGLTPAGRPSPQGPKRTTMEKGESVADFFARD